MRVSVLFLSGDEITVKAKGSWRVWQLKERIRKKCRVPEFEQYFIKQKTKVRSDEVLSTLSSSSEGHSLTMSLVRRAIFGRHSWFSVPITAIRSAATARPALLALLTCS
eukprot:TRINITY_DN13177_c0_g1_i1.p2 TRINITY_DN13177_c0_g1~~TRINITY_DN13177_c0_g1_i1.p2  ORF type:complete len:109 (-),score=15.33 TRINITY_DN13177_c0_g1_i1:333-659(-)